MMDMNAGFAARAALRPMVGFAVVSYGGALRAQSHGPCECQAR
jgi:hypothetical protein